MPHHMNIIKLPIGNFLFVYLKLDCGIYDQSTCTSSELRPICQLECQMSNVKCQIADMSNDSHEQNARAKPNNNINGYGGIAERERG